MLRREPYRLLFPLGALLAWAGVLPWLFFAFRLRSIYEPVTGVLAYRSFLHPLAELDGFLGCFAAGVILTALRPPPAGWQIVVAAVAPLISATCAAIGQWQLGQVASLVLLAVMLQFTLRRLSRPLSLSLLWIAFGFLMGAGGAAVAEVAATRGGSWFWMQEMGRDLVIQGLFTGLAVGAGRVMRTGDRTHPALHLVAGAVFIVIILALVFAGGESTRTAREDASPPATTGLAPRTAPPAVTVPPAQPPSTTGQSQ